mgnify:CR=1 FL=1
MNLTVVIPCRNEINHIEGCIDAIYNSSFSFKINLNVFIVDGMSDDGTIDLLERKKNNYPNLKIVKNYNQLTPFAFNLGINAGGKVDFVQIIGARHFISTNYLETCVNVLKSNSQIWCVGGKIINEFSNKKSQIISMSMSNVFGMGLGNFRTLNSSGFTDTVTSPMYPYWVFEKIGFFDEELIRNQDDDFNYRITKSGGKIYYENNIYLKYYVRTSYKRLWQQFFQYGYWKVYVNKKHKNLTTYRQIIPSFFILYIIFVPLLLITTTFPSIFVLLPLILYMILAIYFSSIHIKYFFSSLKTYFILHFSYGLGYLRGFFDFFIIRKLPSNSQEKLSR